MIVYWCIVIDDELTIVGVTVLCVGVGIVVVGTSVDCYICSS